MASTREIEAAAEAMIDFFFAPHEMPIDAALKQSYMECARIALDAAENQKRLERQGAL